MKRHRLASLIGVAVLAGWAHVARAEPPPRVALRWTAPEGCPPADHVTAEVDRLLGPHGTRPPKPLEAVAVVTEDPAGGVRVHLETLGEGGPRERDIKGAACSALADATALILAMTIDPDAASAAVAPSASSPPAPAAPSSPTRAAPSPPPAPPASRPSPSPRPAPARSGLDLSFRLQGWAGADAGTLPSVAFAAGGAAAVILGPVRIELGAGIWPARAANAEQLPSAGGTVSLVTGSLGACYDVLSASSRSFELGPCAGYELGRLHATGFGVTSPGEASALWSAPKVGGHFAWFFVRQLALVSRLEAAFPLSRPTFVLENVGPVYRSSPAVGRVAAGVEVRLW